MKKIIKESGLTIKEFSEIYEIPYNTVRQWYNEERQAPNYLKKLIEKIENNNSMNYKEVKREKKDFPRANFIIQWKVPGENRIIAYSYTTIEEVKQVAKTLKNYKYRILIIDYEREIEI